MKKLRLKPLLKKIMPILSRLRVYLLASLILMLFGFVALQLQHITNPHIDQASFEQRRADIEANRVRFDQKTLDQVLARSRLGPSTVPSSAGDSNPFD